MIVTCLKCGHASEPTIEPGDTPTAFEDGIFRCNDCGAWMAYGELVPRVLVNTEGARWVTITHDDVVLKLPRVLAAVLADNIRSVAKPGAL